MPAYTYLFTCSLLLVRKTNSWGASLSWRKHGYKQSWKLAMALAGWIKLPPGIELTDSQAAREAVSKLIWTREA